MTATSHAIIGTIIAAKFGNPLLAAPLALVSHFVADVIPHWDTGTNEKKKGMKKVFVESFFDVGLSILAVYVLIYYFFPYTNVGYAYLIAFLAQLPDWLTAPYYFFHITFMKPFYNFQKLFDNKLDKPWGVVTQVGFLALALLLAKVV